MPGTTTAPESPWPDLPDGLDGTTGGYLHPAAGAAEIAALARGRGPDRREAAEVREWLRGRTEAHLGPRPGIDPRDLAATGWGVAFPRQADPAVRDALSPLLEHRRRQAAARRETFFREFSGPEGVGPGETKASFLDRHGAGGGGAADPRQMPYYLLLVGGPEAIPFELQHQLDVQYAVGRIAFDTPEEYAGYAAAVVAADGGDAPPPAPDRPLRHQHPRRRRHGADGRAPGAPPRRRPGRRAAGRGGRSGDRGGGDQGPPPPAPRRRGSPRPPVHRHARHGLPGRRPAATGRAGRPALPGLAGAGRLAGAGPPEHYLGAADVGGGASPAGRLSFHFSCHSAGTPRVDACGEARAAAPGDFLARLPQRLLAHPRGGALAVVGHVGRTWGHSFLWKGAHPEVFADALGLLLDGWQVGAALELFGQRYAALATELVEMQRLTGLGRQTPPEDLARLWTATQDARSYLLLGDPAVRLPAAPAPAA